MSKNLRDLHGPALALVLERLKPSGPFQGAFVVDLAGFVFSLLFVMFFIANLLCFFPDSFESAKSISTGPASRSSLKVGKSVSNGIPKHGTRALSSVCFTCSSFFLRHNMRY